MKRILLVALMFVMGCYEPIHEQPEPVRIIYVYYPQDCMMYDCIYRYPVIIHRRPFIVRPVFVRSNAPVVRPSSRSK